MKRILPFLFMFLFCSGVFAGTVYDPILGRMKQAELPSGGNEGQVLKKSSGTGVEWGEDGGGTSYLYIAYASDGTGTGFTTTFDPDLEYIAFLYSETEIASPVAGDFEGLWKKYVGEGLSSGADGTYGIDVYPNTVVSGVPARGAGLRPNADGTWSYYDIATDSWVQMGTSTSTLSYPEAGIAVSTGTAWDTSLTLDTDLTSVSTIHDSAPSAKATKDYVDALVEAAMADLGVPELDIAVPSPDGTWTQDLTYNLFEGTAQSSAGLDTIEWKLEAGGEYAAVTDDASLGTGVEAWSIPTVTLVEDDMATVYVKAVSDTGLQRIKTRTIYGDATDPVVDLAAVHDPANPATHDGTGTGFFVLDWAEQVTETYPSSARYRWTDGATVGDWVTWASPYADVSASLPQSTNTLTLGVEVTDLSGRTGSDTAEITYSASACDTLDGDSITGGTGCSYVLGGSTSGRYEIASALILSGAVDVCAIGVDLKRTNTAPGTLTLKVYERSTSDPIFGTLVATSSNSFTYSNVGTGQTEIVFTFASDIEFTTRATGYWVSIVTDTLGDSAAGYYYPYYKAGTTPLFAYTTSWAVMTSNQQLNTYLYTVAP